jgi:heat-inducible transcriptional repressor
MTSLTARQTQILKVIIDEYIETAEPVGSQALEKRYNLGVSPATIRKEMHDLTQMNYLKQPHTSAGRIPTPLAMKFYIDQLMEEKEMSLTEEVKAKEEVRQVKNDFDKLMQEATHSLAKATQSLTVAVTDEGDSWTSGYAHVFDSPEFNNFLVCQNLFSFLEEAKRMHELFFERFTGVSPIEVLFGEDLGWPHFEPVGVVATRFKSGDHTGALGVIGPYRLNYKSVIPTLRFFREVVEEAAR